MNKIAYFCCQKKKYSGKNGVVLTFMILFHTWSRGKYAVSLSASKLHLLRGVMLVEPHEGSLASHRRVVCRQSSGWLFQVIVCILL